MPPKRKAAAVATTETRVETAMLDMLANPERMGSPQELSNRDMSILSDAESVASDRSGRSGRSARSARSERSEHSERSARSARSARSVRSARDEKERQPEIATAGAASAPSAPTSAVGDEDERKRAAYVKLMRFTTLGQGSSRVFTPDDTAADMEREVLLQEAILRERLGDERVKDGVKFSRRMLLAFTSFTEFMNRRYDPFGVDIDGWSDAVMQNISEYDRPFERLVRKYQGRAEMAPEVELLVTLGSSLFMFHLSKSLANRMAGMAGMATQPAESREQAKAHVVQMLSTSDDEED